MERFIKKFFGEILIVIGIGIFSYNIFNFNYETYEIYEKRSLLPKLSGPAVLEGGVAYYYTSNTLFLVAIGAMLVAGGILIIKNRKK